MPFVKGQSGNAGGRPKVVAEVRELAQRHTTTAIDALVNILQNPDAPPAAQVLAVGVILDRAYGKAVQAIEISGTIEHVVIDMIRDLDSPVIEHGDGGSAGIEPIMLPAMLPSKANGAD